MPWPASIYQLPAPAPESRNTPQLLLHLVVPDGRPRDERLRTLGMRAARDRVVHAAEAGTIAGGRR